MRWPGGSPRALQGRIFALASAPVHCYSNDMKTAPRPQWMELAIKAVLALGSGVAVALLC